jgi:hypothetical protein
VLLVGQSLVLHRGPLAAALQRRDLVPLVANARRQVDLGAGAIDVNVGRQGTAEDLAWVVGALREAGVTTPLWLDSPDTGVLAETLERARGIEDRGTLVVNAVPVAPASRDAANRLLEAAATGVTPIVISPYLTDTSHTPGITSPEAVLDTALNLAQIARAAGVTAEVYVDVLAWPLVTDPARCRVSLDLLALTAEAGDAVVPLAAVGNVSYSLDRFSGGPARALYAAAAARAGARALILPVEDRGCVQAARTGLTEPPPGADRATLDAWRRMAALLDPPDEG